MATSYTRSEETDTASQLSRARDAVDVLRNLIGKTHYLTVMAPVTQFLSEHAKIVNAARQAIESVGENLPANMASADSGDAEAIRTQEEGLRMVRELSPIAMTIIATTMANCIKPLATADRRAIEYCVESTQSKVEMAYRARLSLISDAISSAQQAERCW